MEGERYTITTFASYIPDPVGIMMKGEIYGKAKKPESGKNYVETLNPRGLKYYRTEVQEGPSLLIKVKGLSEFAELIWYDTENGGYSPAGTEWGEDVKSITVTGLSGGTVCYFYISGDTEYISPGHTFEVRLTEN